MAMKKQKRAGTAKSSVIRGSRTVQESQVPTAGTPGAEQDTKRRLGNFTSAGEHARLGGRTSGIVGQKTSQLHTDGRKKI